MNCWGKSVPVRPGARKLSSALRASGRRGLRAIGCAEAQVARVAERGVSEPGDLLSFLLQPPSKRAKLVGSRFCDAWEYLG